MSASSHLNVAWITGLFVVIGLSASWGADVRALPDTHLTPGITRPLSLRDICTTKWGRDARAATTSMKKAVFLEYGFSIGNKDRRCPCEIDHLISREIGGADDIKNLWVQSYRGPWNAHMKDRVENRLHKEVCAGNVRSMMRRKLSQQTGLRSTESTLAIHRKTDQSVNKIEKS